MPGVCMAPTEERLARDRRAGKPQGQRSAAGGVEDGAAGRGQDNMRVGKIDETVADRVFPGAGERAGAAPGLARLGDAARRRCDPDQKLYGDETRRPRHDRPPCCLSLILAPSAARSTMALAAVAPKASRADR